MMRELYKALTGFEAAFEQQYGLSLNEAMVLCALHEAKKEMTSTAIAERTELAPSHTSKVIRSVEIKGLIQRDMGKVDKRQMYFSLTAAGKTRLQAIQLDEVEVPGLLKPLFEESPNGGEILIPSTP